MSHLHPSLLARKALFALLVLPAPATAMTWTVCQLGCDRTTLQGAIDSAASGDDILLQTSQLNEAEIVVTKSLRILGLPIKGTSVLAAPSPATGIGRVFTILPGIAVSMTRLEIRNGSNNDLGGAIHNQGELQLFDVKLKDNESDLGGAIHNEGELSLENVVVEANSAYYGGGIHQSAGSAVLRNVLLEGNDANNFGGGLYLTGGVVDGRDLVLESNRSGLFGGGIHVEAGALSLGYATFEGNSSREGGGLFTESPTAPRLYNTTFSRNRATEDGGGIYVHGQRSLRLASSTVTKNRADSDGMTPVGNGGGVYLGNECMTLICTPARFLVQNSIIAHNEGVDGSDCDGKLTSHGFNLVLDAATGIGAPNPCRVEGDLTGVLVGVDPLLELLDDNGGPPIPDAPMETNALGPGSPAIDAGDPDGCRDHDGNRLSTDQRRAARVGRCDLGAFEYGGVPLSGIFGDGFESGDLSAWW